MNVLKRYGWPFALYTAIGLLFFGYHYLDDLARMQQGTFLPRLTEELSGVYSAFVLLPFVIWFVRRFPWPAQIAGALFYSAAHTTLMALSRSVLFPLEGLGRYDYGIMWFRYPMEASQDVIVYAVIAGFVYAFDRVRRAQQAEIAAAQLQRELAEAKLENLRLQLQPHFLFNTLNAVSSVMYEDVRKADAMLAKLSEFLRLVLSSADVQHVTLAEELQMERMYADVMKARLESQLELSYAIEPGAAEARVPSLLLQPLIENAIRHGMRPGGDLHIHVSARVCDGVVEIAVRDDGTGFPGEFRAAGHGLANVRSRLAHMHGPRARFEIRALVPCGTEAIVSLPAQA